MCRQDESAAAPGKDVGDAGKPATAKSPAQRRVESSEDDEVRHFLHDGDQYLRYLIVN